MKTAKSGMVNVLLHRLYATDSASEPQPSRRSLLGLDGLNFLMADVRGRAGAVPVRLPKRQLALAARTHRHRHGGQQRGGGAFPDFLVALATLPVRGVLFSCMANPYGVVAIQLLDGVAAGIFGVISVVIAADLRRGTGRFNLAQGLVALAIGLGAGLSNVVSGYIVQAFGYPAGFLSLAARAGGARVFFALLMPETRDSKAPESSPAAA